MKMIINDRLTDTPTVAAGTGFFYGYGIFETVLVTKGKAVFAKAHLERMNEGLIKLGIHRSVEMQSLSRAVEQLEIKEGVLKINVTEDEVVYSTRPVTYTEEQYQEGAKLSLSPVRRNSTSPSVALKTMNYLDNLMVLKKVRAQGCQDALFLNERDEVCETAVANLFMLKDERLMTPHGGSGLLKGIVRGWVLDVTEVEETKIIYKDLMEADGVFITNSVMGLMKVSEIDGIKIAEHAMVDKLREQYLDMIGSYGA